MAEKKVAMATVAAAAVPTPLVAMHMDVVYPIIARHYYFFSCSIPRTWAFTTNTVCVYWRDCSTKL